VDALQQTWDPLLTSLHGKRVGDKQLDSRAYKVGHTKGSRTKAEINNAYERRQG